ncbi:S41 family peptidase [Caldalkalibacillus mannanilyticus]|uniref:S41 family peptidase n=1 Tax=Caldalkalibacillus mannanilyticus TaxID=1418 RepID=UPI000468F4FA|nr:S41 family peptidase [Caldalkalibacillus mannanilyticus]
MQRQTVWTKYIKITLALLLLSSLLAPVAYAEKSQKEEELYKEIYDYIKYFHISDPTDEQLNKDTIEELIKAVNDPFTQYLAPEQLELFAYALEGELAESGLFLEQQGNEYVIAGFFPESPADKADLQVGDILVKVNEQEVTGLDPENVSLLLIGPVDSEMKLTVKRDGTTKEVVLKRVNLQGPPLFSTILDGNIGYIALTSFGNDLSHKFTKELNELKKQNLNGLIFDLRGNLGGDITAAYGVVANFIESGTYIIHKESSGRTSEFKIRDGKHMGNVPVVLLVNEWSASASEMVAGALQDQGVATLIGVQTYGKGIAQKVFNLSNGGALLVTFMEYFTPHLNKVNEVGITPDLVVEADLSSGKDTQLEAAMNLLSKKGVFAISSGEIIELDSVVIKKDGKTYVSIRDFSRKVGGKLFYEVKDKTFTYQLGEHKLTEKLGQSKHVLVENNKAYIEVDYLKDQLKQLRIFNR